jgi:hypothetical protein
MEVRIMSKTLMGSVVLCTAVLLTGCGGGGDDGAASNGNGGNGAPADPLGGVPSSASQSSQGLVAYLKALVKTTPEDREAAPLDMAAPPASDAAEPESLG